MLSFYYIKAMASRGKNIPNGLPFIIILLRTVIRVL